MFARPSAFPRFDASSLHIQAQRHILPVLWRGLICACSVDYQGISIVVRMTRPRSNSNRWSVVVRSRVATANDPGGDQPRGVIYTTLKRYFRPTDQSTSDTVHGTMDSVACWKARSAAVPYYPGRSISFQAVDSSVLAI